MNARTALSAFGVGVATFVGVGTAVSMLLGANSPYGALVGVPAGLLLGVGATIFAYVALGRGVTPRFRRFLIGTAAAGYGALALLFLWNVSADLRAATTVRDVSALVAFVGVATYAALLVRDR